MQVKAAGGPFANATSYTLVDSHPPTLGTLKKSFNSFTFVHSFSIKKTMQVKAAGGPFASATSYTLVNSHSTKQTNYCDVHNIITPLKYGYIHYCFFTDRPPCTIRLTIQARNHK